MGSNLSAYMPQGAYMKNSPAMGMGRLGYMNPGSFLQKQMGAYMPASGFGGYDSESM